jgi:hypothetical protein
MRSAALGGTATDSRHPNADHAMTQQDDMRQCRETEPAPPREVMALDARRRCRRCGMALERRRVASPAARRIDAVRQRRLARSLPTYALRVRELDAHRCDPSAEE